MWNYRIIRHRTNGETWYGLHEVYYRKNGKRYLWSPEAEVIGDTKQEVVRALVRMIRGATDDVPVLNKRDMPGNQKKKRRRENSDASA